MLDTIQVQTPLGCLGNKIPIYYSQRVLLEEAKATCTEIINAYNFLINEKGKTYTDILEKVEEIHIVKTVFNANKIINCDLVYTENKKPILRFNNKMEYMEIVYCIMYIKSELEKNKRGR